MDAFALARFKARAVREGIGASFKLAIDLVRQALLEKRYEIQRAPINGVLLRGDDAQLRRDFSQVLVRDDVRPTRKLSPARRARTRAPRASSSSRLLRTGRERHWFRLPGALTRRDIWAARAPRASGQRLCPRVHIATTYRGDNGSSTRNYPLPRSPSVSAFLSPRPRRQILRSLLKPEDAIPKEVSSNGAVKLDPSQQKAVDFDGRALLSKPDRGRVRPGRWYRASSVASPSSMPPRSSR